MRVELKVFSLIALAMLLHSCRWLMIGSFPKPSSFKYYSKDFKLQLNSPLKFNGFYYFRLETKSNGELYSYLRFYEDGRVVSNLTAGTPERIKESYWSFNHVFGYYRLDGNHLKYELKSNYGTYLHGEGEVINDSLFLKILNKSNYEDTLYYRNYIFHSGFAQ